VNKKSSAYRRQHKPITRHISLTAYTTHLQPQTSPTDSGKILAILSLLKILLLAILYSFKHSPIRSKSRQRVLMRPRLFAPEPREIPF